MVLRHRRPIDRRTLMTRSAAAAAFAGLLHRQVLAGQASPSPAVEGEAMQRLVAGNTSFALDLYREFRAAVDGNIVFSPYSVSLALAMTYAGARGETAVQMEDVLSFALTDSDLVEAFQSLNADLLDRGNGDDDRGERELHIANALWGEQSFPFAESFMETLETSYDAGMQTADFMNDPDAAREEINDWVADQTNDRIEEIVPEGVIDEATRLVLANAIFFSSNWQSTFEKDDTEDETFHLVDGSTVDTPFMRQTAYYRYHEADLAQLVEMPYVADGFSMTIVLPNEDQFDAVESGLDGDALTAMVDSLESSRVKLHLPKFEFDVGESLVAMLEALGMTDAFDPDQADLSGMVEDDAGDRLMISDVLHEAFISVDEEGTEAAASTVVAVAPTSAPVVEEPVVVRIDRPFLFAIRDTRTGTVLFLGRVMDPGGKGA